MRLRLAMAARTGRRPTCRRAPCRRLPQAMARIFNNGGRGALMSHNSINDVPAHADGELMDQLRDWAKSDGVLVASDMCDVGLLAFPGSATSPPTRGFGVAANLSAAGAMSMRAGMDQGMQPDRRPRHDVPAHGAGGGGQGAAAGLARSCCEQRAALQGRGAVVMHHHDAALCLPAQLADCCCARLLCSLRQDCLTTQSSTPHKRPINTPSRGFSTEGGGRGSAAPERGRRAWIAAAGALKTVAIIGSVANDTQSQCGGYTNFGAEVETVLAAAKLLFRDDDPVRRGAVPTGNDTTGFAEALKIAEQADAVVFVAGDSGAKGWNRNLR